MGLALSIGMPFGLLVSSGALAGYWLDGRFGTRPWLTLSGIVLGSAAAVLNMLRVLAWWERQGGDDPPSGAP